MGFFSKIKSNFKHGGVKIQLQAPASASLQDAMLPVAVSLTASESQAQINSVSVMIMAESQNQSFQQPSAANTNVQTTEHVVANSSSTEMITLMPGETRTIQINIVLNAGAALGSQLPEGSGLAQVAGVLQKLQSIENAMNSNSYTYYLSATADVEGITLDPSARQPIQILQPGQVGTALNIKF